MVGFRAIRAGGTRVPPALLTVALLAGCGPGGAESPQATEGEAHALEDAAEMLDSQRLPAAASPDPAQGASPEDESAR